MDYFNLGNDCQSSWLWQLVEDWETEVWSPVWTDYWPLDLPKQSSKMIVTSLRIDCCADYLNKKTDLIIEKYKIIQPEWTPMESSGDCKPQKQCRELV